MMKVWALKCHKTNIVNWSADNSVWEFFIIIIVVIMQLQPVHSQLCKRVSVFLSFHFQIHLKMNSFIAFAHQPLSRWWKNKWQRTVFENRCCSDLSFVRINIHDVKKKLNMCGLTSLTRWWRAQRAAGHTYFCQTGLKMRWVLILGGQKLVWSLFQGQKQMYKSGHADFLNLLNSNCQDATSIAK